MITKARTITFKDVTSGSTVLKDLLSLEEGKEITIISFAFNTMQGGRAVVYVDEEKIIDVKVEALELLYGLLPTRVKVVGPALIKAGYEDTEFYVSETYATMFYSEEKAGG